MDNKNNGSSHFGSDHYVHISILDKIKSNKYQFSVKRISGYNEENTAYPILFHWLLARFFYSSTVNRPNRINFVINVIALLFFNFFLGYFVGIQDWYFIFKANLLYVSFPFSYLSWNAKNVGLSARGFGLLVGQLFTYSLVFYFEDGGILIGLLLMTILSFIALLGSQFAFQYSFFISIVASIIFSKVELLAPSLLSITLFLVCFPKLSIEFFKGQYNHKRNYALFLAPVFILKARPSIYRDFIYDFWVKLSQLKKERVKALYYIYSNPILELIYGFPFLWVFLYYRINERLLVQLDLFSILIGSSLLIFFLISLRPLRFLGEPQRYVEFMIPLISISFLHYVPDLIQYVVIIASILFIFLTKFVFKFFKNHSNFNEMISFLTNNFDKKILISSNDSNFSKFLIPYFNVVKTDLTRYYRNVDEFNFYHNNDYAIQSVRGLLAFHKQHQLNLIIINPNLYAQMDMDKLHSELNLKRINTINNYIIYKTLDDKRIS